MSILQEIIKAKKLEFNELRKYFYPASPNCYLLQLDGDDSTYSVKLTLTKDWYLDVRAGKLLIAADGVEIGQKLKVAGYFSVNSRVYEFRDDDGDGGDGQVPPEGEEPWWKLSFKRTGQTFSPD